MGRAWAAWPGGRLEPECVGGVYRRAWIHASDFVPASELVWCSWVVFVVLGRSSSWLPVQASTGSTRGLEMGLWGLLLECWSPLGVVLAPLFC